MPAREFRLLEYLMRHAGRVVSRGEILDAVWGYGFDPGTNVVEVHVCRLRERIERDERSRLLKTVRGKGYLLSEEP
jgi:two-component system OmpR family response regulator